VEGTDSSCGLLDGRSVLGTAAGGHSGTRSTEDPGELGVGWRQRLEATNPKSSRLLPDSVPDSLLVSVHSP
jgi:hypothetical protein